MRRREFLAAGSACLVAPLLGAAEPREGVKRPNILYILTDQWRASATGYEGDPNVKTPNLDKLEKESLNFSNAVSVCPVCTPHRASLMTGRFPTSTGMFLNDAYLPDGERCIAEVLSEAGYATGYIGKWHLDGHGRDAFVPPERRQGWQYWKAAECEHNYRHSHYYANESPEKRYWEGDYDAFPQTRDAQKYIREHAGGTRPFALLVSYGGPHPPHPLAPEAYKDMYPPREIQLPPNVPQNMKAVARKAAQGFYAHCTALDKCVGDLLKTLEETGIVENTIFVFTSDHGETLGSHNVIPRMKQVPWSVSSRVPFLLRYPAAHGKKGRVIKTPLNTPDIFPTLTALAGVKTPENVEGEDLSALIIGQTGEMDRAALFMNVSPFSIRPSYRKPYRAIQTATHTYVRGLEGPWLLYDNVKDPDQLHNLVPEPEQAELVAALDARLQERLDAVGDAFHPGKWYLREWGYDVEAQSQALPMNPAAPDAAQAPKRKAQ